MDRKRSRMYLAAGVMAVVWALYGYLAFFRGETVESAARNLEVDVMGTGPEASAPEALPAEEDPGMLPPPDTEVGGTISYGQRVTITDHIVAGKTTIFDFYSDYCPPCRTLSPRLEELDRKHDDIVVIKVDINRPGVRGIDWDSPVAEQYGIRTVPHVVIYGPNGRMLAEGAAARSRVEAWMAG